MLARPTAVAFLLLVALAGCSDAPKADDVADASPDATAGAQVASLGVAPAWSVGESWDHHLYFGPQDTTGVLVRAIVVSNGTDGYRLATDEAIDAATHAAFYLHDQGVMSTSDWTVRDFGGSFSFPWYSFPMTDGKTWKGREENLDFNLARVSRDITMTAKAVNGTAGAFTIEARDGDGLRARYDYQPSLGWFSEYTAFDPADPDPSHYNVRMLNEAHVKGWSGTYYTAQADFLLNTVTVVAPTSPTPPPPPASFTISEGHTEVLALPFVFAAGGASAAELVAPDGQHWDAYVVADQDGASWASGSSNFVYVPAVPGEWRWATVGAGAFVAGGGCFAWGVTMASGTL
jgi:hypothetical protein